MSFPPGTEMFQFPGFASRPYVFRSEYPKGVGFPIRTSADQRLLASPRGFSQRATSFIASWRQGIHRMPFSHSISTPPPAHRAKPRSPMQLTTLSGGSARNIPQPRGQTRPGDVRHLLTHTIIFTMRKNSTPDAPTRFPLEDPRPRHQAGFGSAATPNGRSPQTS